MKILKSKDLRVVYDQVVNSVQLNSWYNVRYKVSERTLDEIWYQTWDIVEREFYNNVYENITR